MAKFTSLLRHNWVISSFGHMMPYSEVFFNGYFICIHFNKRMNFAPGIRKSDFHGQV